MFGKNHFLFLVFGILSFAASAQAGDFGLGMGGITIPHYLGSGHAYQVVAPFPFFVPDNDAIHYSNRWFILDFAGDVTLPVTGMDLADAEPEGYGDDSKYVSGFKNYDRRGMDHIPPSLYLGFKTGVQFGPFSALVSVTPGLRVGGAGGYAGTITKFTMKLALFANNSGKSARCLCLISDGISTDGEYNKTFYSVEPERVLADRPAYDAKRAGFLGVVSGLYYMHRIRSLTLLGFANMQDMRNSIVQESPLVKKELGYASGLGLAYLF